MTDNQEKEVFLLLNTIAANVQSVQSDVQDIKQTLDQHSKTLDQHSKILDRHSKTLNRLDAKTDTIAEIVIKNDNRLNVVEKDVADLRSGVH